MLGSASCWIRSLSLACLVVSWPISTRAGLVTAEEEVDGGTIMVYRMTVTPAAEPVPALKHRLVLPEHKLKRGNAATHYFRSMAENTLRGSWKGVRTKYGEAVDDWYGTSVPIEDLPMDDMRKAAAAFDTVVNQFVRRGTERRDCDLGFDLAEMSGLDTIAFLLPATQEMRSLCRAVALQTRLAIAEGRYEDAIDLMRMNYRLGQDVATGETLVNGLVGLAIHGVTTANAVDLAASPGSPNLYWALGEVQPIDLRRATRFEMSLGSRLVPAMDEAENAEHSPEEWARLFNEAVDETLGLVSGGVKTALVHQERALLGLATTGAALVMYPSAKQRLLASGIDPALVEAMAVGQVILLDGHREFRRVADEAEKWLYVPWREARARAEELNDVFDQAGNSLGNYGAIVASLLLPAVEAARTAEVRMQWDMNALRLVEALRMHAAENGGWPASLDDVTIVPLPKNPATGKDYRYRLERDTAVVEQPMSDGFPGVGRRFELTLAEGE
ncbi:MAG: hypothetical protein AAGA92_05250 [Planctomycetota bacterium]